MTASIMSRKTKRNGITHTLNIMVSGHSHTGKTSFIRTLVASLADKHDARYVATTSDVSPLSTPPSSLPSSPLGSQSALNGVVLSENMHLLFPPTTRNQMNPLVPSDVTEPTALPGYIEFNGDEDEKIRLSLIDTPGLPIPVNIHKQQQLLSETRGIHPQSIPNTPSSPLLTQDQIDEIVSDWLGIICKYMDSTFEKTLLEESKVRRNPKTPDHHVHACIYLMDPCIILACQGLTVMDRVVLKALCTRVNVVPVVAKSDILTLQQTDMAKRWIIEDLQRHDIPIQYFEDVDEEEDEEEDEYRDMSLRNVYPLMLINSEDMPDGQVGIHDAQGNHFLGRMYRWGCVQVEHPEHCDFLKLKTLLFSSHILDFKTVTKETLYENWRTQKLLQVRESVLSNRTSPTKPHNQTPLLLQKTADTVYDH